MSKISDEVFRMLSEVSGALNSAEVPYAVGGAVAMALYGARRETLDVDVFSLPEAKGQVLTSLKAAGYQIEPIGAPFLYVAYPPWETSDRDVRVDLLFPEDDPDVSAVETADLLEMPKGVRVRVFSPLMLTLSRLYSGQPKHLADLQIMYDHGVIPIEEVALVLQEHDPEMLVEFKELILRIAKPRRKRKPPGKFGKKPK